MSVCAGGHLSFFLLLLTHHLHPLLSSPLTLPATATESPVDVDIVSGVPDSSIAAAIGYANATHLPFTEVRTVTVGLLLWPGTIDTTEVCRSI